MMTKKGETHKEAFEFSSCRWLRLLISESVKGEKEVQGHRGEAECVPHMTVRKEKYL